jgi:hypothetical protein
MKTSTTFKVYVICLAALVISLFIFTSHPLLFAILCTLAALVGFFLRKEGSWAWIIWICNAILWYLIYYLTHFIKK